MSRRRALRVAAAASVLVAAAATSTISAGTARATSAAGTTSTTRSVESDFLGLNGTDVDSMRAQWGEPGFAGGIRKLEPGSLRIFAGSTANYWDWQKGYFVPRTGNFEVPDQSTANPLHIGRIAHVVSVAGTQPIFDLNMLTSTLDSQLNLLKRAAALGMPITRVELGNEFALSHPDYENAFPTGAAYGIEATQWATAIKQLFPNVEISVPAANGITSGSNVDARRKQWNSSMLANLHDVDALTFHTYFSSDLPSGAAPDNAANTATVMKAVSDDWSIIDADDLSILPPGMSAWITEFGILDTQARIQGTWAHGLAMADFALQGLARPQVQLLDAQGLEGSGVTSALYAGTKGLNYNSPYLGPKNPTPTTTFGQSSLGVALGAVMTTLHGGGNAYDIVNNDPAQPGISMAAVSTPDGERLVVVNTCGSPEQVSVPYWSDGTSKVETWSAAPDSYANGMTPVRSRGSVGTMTVPAYSLTTVAAAA